MMVEDSPRRAHTSIRVSPSRSADHARFEAQVGRRDWCAVGADMRSNRSSVSERSTAVDQYIVRSLLVCGGCDRPLQASSASTGEREYVFLCGCRRNGVDAGLVEQLVRERVEAESAVLLTGIAIEELLVVFRSLFAEVRIGGVAEDLEFVWRV